MKKTQKGIAIFYHLISNGSYVSSTANKSANLKGDNSRFFFIKHTELHLLSPQLAKRK